MQVVESHVISGLPFEFMLPLGTFELRRLGMVKHFHRGLFIRRICILDRLVSVQLRQLNGKTLRVLICLARVV